MAPRNDISGRTGCFLSVPQIVLKVMFHTRKLQMMHGEIVPLSTGMRICLLARTRFSLPGLLTIHGSVRDHQMQAQAAASAHGVYLWPTDCVAAHL